jgi:hypothetical protein
MSMSRESCILSSLGIIAGFLLLASRPAAAQAAEDEVQQGVARVSYLSGEVSFARGDDPDNWQNAALNVPMTLGDRLYSAEDGRAELAILGGDYVRLAAQTDFSALNLTDEVKQFSLAAGAASFHIRHVRQDETFEVDTPNVAVTFDVPGDYRIDVDADGNSRVQVRRGQAVVAAGGGQVSVDAGSEMKIDGIDSPQYDIVGLSRSDSFDQWVNQRQRRLISPRSYRYVNASIVGAEDLDSYGRWDNIPSYGYCWTPANVEAGWQPYRLGHWVWIDPWGWTWVGDEPWGWAPYHYGRWVTSSSRWYWVPVAPSATYVSYSPALVAFVGGGPGWSGSVTVGGGGYVGWFPLAPRDPFNPWWGSRAALSVNVSNVTYVNRNYVTVVNHNTFVSGGYVATSVVRDPVVVRQVVSAPVIRGALPVMPTVSSLRVSAKANLPAPSHPSARVIARPVVTRVATPPAPPRFEAKMAAIRENKGAPVSAAAAAKISVEAQNGAKPVTAVRPVAAHPGQVSFAPRGNAGASVAKPQPVTAPKGKALATAERPVVASPTAAAKANAPAPEKVAPGAVVVKPAPAGAPAPAQPPARRFEEKPVLTPPPAQKMEQKPAPTPPPAEKIEQKPAPQAQPQKPAAEKPPEGWRNRPAPKAGQPPAAEKAPQGQPQGQKPLAPRGESATPPPERRPETMKQKPSQQPAQPEAQPRQREMPPPGSQAAPPPPSQKQRLEEKKPGTQAAPAPQQKKAPAKPEEKKPPKKPEDKNKKSTDQ